MRVLIRNIFISLIILFLGSCSRIKDWSKDTFPQEISLENYKSIIKPYCATIRLYDYFQTKGIFDILWLSDDVRTAYVEVFSRKQGKSLNSKNSMIRRQLEENNLYITFYVLISKREELGRADSQWSVSLEVDGQVYIPKKVKKVEAMSPEYKSFFGDRFNSFKDPYIVRFDACSWDKKPILTADTRFISILFKSSEIEGIFSWELDENGKVIRTFVNRDNDKDKISNVKKTTKKKKLIKKMKSKNQ